MTEMERMTKAILGVVRLLGVIAGAHLAAATWQGVKLYLLGRAENAGDVAYAGELAAIVGGIVLLATSGVALLYGRPGAK